MATSGEWAAEHLPLAPERFSQEVTQIILLTFLWTLGVTWPCPTSGVGKCGEAPGHGWGELEGVFLVQGMWQRSIGPLESAGGERK